ncbi:hypothetical protein G3I76_72280, partial [Streptomyces sp. SID11233]|nr:hypothetical protein [Streptomyces sp. SID11233]
MNPHDPSTHPGRHAISERFGVTDLRPLSKALPPADPVRVMARLVTEAADTLDALHQRLTERAARAIRALLPVSEGSTDNLIGAGGVMPDLAHSLELLSTRRAGAYDHLNQAISGLRAIMPPGAEGARLL